MSDPGTAEAGLFGAQLAADVPIGLGAAMAGGKGALSSTPRAAHDYYPTPADVTAALIAECGTAMRCRGPMVWEPCARGGAMSAVLMGAGFPVVGTDIVADPAHDVAALDVLQCRRRKADVVVTNPPFAIAPDIIAHLLGTLRVPYLALLLKATFWHAANRQGHWREYRPSGILALTWRPDFLDRGAPTMDVIWCVWDRFSAGGTSYELLARPRAGGRGDLFAEPGA